MAYDFQTSHPNYKKNSHWDYCRRIVYTTIEKLQPCNDRQISEKLKWPINRVTPRRGELVSMGLVMSAGKYADPVTGRTVNYWKIAKRWEQLVIF